MAKGTLGFLVEGIHFLLSFIKFFSAFCFVARSPLEPSLAVCCIFLRFCLTPECLSSSSLFCTQDQQGNCRALCLKANNFKMATVDHKPSTRLFPTCFLREKGDTCVAHWNKQQRLLPATGGDPSPASPVTIAGSLMPQCSLGSSAVVEYLVLHFQTPGSHG